MGRVVSELLNSEHNFTLFRRGNPVSRTIHVQFQMDSFYQLTTQIGIEECKYTPEECKKPPEEPPKSVVPTGV